jgi:hypothetical protein
VPRFGDTDVFPVPFEQSFTVGDVATPRVEREPSGGDAMATRKGPISVQAASPLSPLVGSLGPVLSIQERDVDGHSSI